MADEFVTAIGSIIVIAIVAVVYYVFSQMDNKNADKFVDRHVKKTMADVELEKLKAQQEETRLKREFFEFEKTRLLEEKKNPIQQPAPKSKSGLISYVVKDEDKSKKPQ